MSNQLEVSAAELFASGMVACLVFLSSLCGWLGRELHNTDVAGNRSPSELAAAACLADSLDSPAFRAYAF